MTETSFYWNGLVTGDAILAPYTSDRYHNIWQVLFTGNDANEGIINNFLNELEVEGITGGVKVKTGVALVDGLFYENNSALSFEIAEPVTNPRIDRVVIRKNWGTQRVRATIITGTENAFPTAPAIIQTDLAEWDIPLAQFLITTSGTITVTDERENSISPLGFPGGMKLIERIELASADATINFTDIPQTYKHLHIEGNIRSNRTGSFNDSVRHRYNGDSGTNYSGQAYLGQNATATATATVLTTSSGFGIVDTADGLANQLTAVSGRVSNYRGNYFKTSIGETAAFADGVVGTPFFRYNNNYIWINTDDITSILFFLGSGNTFAIGSTLSLYGLS